MANEIYVSKKKQYIKDSVSDLKLNSTNNNLYLIDDLGNKVGKGIILPVSSGESGEGGTDIKDDETLLTATWSSAKINQMFEDLKYIPIKINSFKTSLSTLVYEIGQTLENIQFTWSLSKKATSIFLTDCSVRATDASVIYPQMLEETKTFTLTVTDNKNATTSASITIYFVSPFYYGTYDDSLTPSYVSSQSKIIQTKGNKSIKMTYNDKKVFFAYPKEYGPLREIKDNNGFNYINDFTQQTMTIQNIVYYIYALEDKSSAKDITFTFNF